MQMKLIVIALGIIALSIFASGTSYGYLPSVSYEEILAQQEISYKVISQNINSEVILADAHKDRECNTENFIAKKISNMASVTLNDGNPLVLFLAISLLIIFGILDAVAIVRFIMHMNQIGKRKK